MPAPNRRGVRPALGAGRFFAPRPAIPPRTAGTNLPAFRPWPVYNTFSVGRPAGPERGGGGGAGGNKTFEQLGMKGTPGGEREA
jgi:hypothetical protein